MDYLNKAIDKARLKREGAIGRTPSSSSVTTTAVERSFSAPQVNYSVTRRLEPDGNVLLHNRIIAGEIEDPRVEIYRQLRSQVLSAMKMHGWSTLAVTGPGENVGKTLTSINLAITIAHELNHTVMLVDLDLRKPNVHEALGLDVEFGIVDHLLQGKPIEDILINPGIPRLVVLPGLPQGRHVSELLTAPEMKALLGDITRRYSDRIVIFDLPPLLRNDDAMVFVPNVEACLMVVEDGVTTPSEIKRSLHLLKDAELLGTILNKARQ